MKLKYVYIEVKSYSSQKVEHRLNVTGKNLKQIEKAEQGLNINLDSDYYAVVKAYLTPQPLKP